MELDQQELHPAVKLIAKDIELEDGVMRLSDTNTTRHRARLSVLKTPDDKKQALVSLVALASRLMREGGEATAPVVARLMDLSASLIGDPEKARALFASVKPPGPEKK